MGRRFSRCEATETIPVAITSAKYAGCMLASASPGDAGGAGRAANPPAARTGVVLVVVVVVGVSVEALIAGPARSGKGSAAVRGSAANRRCSPLPPAR